MHVFHILDQILSVSLLYFPNNTQHTHTHLLTSFFNTRKTHNKNREREKMKASLLEKLNAYKCYADECIRFHIIYDENDLARLDQVNNQSDDSAAAEDDNSFKPEFVHQIFGQEETIFGYKNLHVNYCLTPATLDAYIGLSFKDKVTPQRFDGIEADDIYAAFTKFGCSPGFTRNLDVFTTQKLAQDRQFKPYGVKVDEYSQESNTYEVFKIDSSMNEYTDEQFLAYIDRIQTMLVFYIETSSFIDTEDTEWVYFILYEKKQTPSGWRYATIGFLSVYNFYSYPDKKRSRISQILILPNHQSKGHASRLVESVYKDALQHSDSISDITAETPSPEFVQVRDYVTAKLCHTNLASFRDKEQLKKGFTEQMAQEALVKLKIPRLQSKRCYEILRLAVTNENIDDEWRAYRLEIKKRLYLPFIRRTKYARNAGTVNDEDYNPEPVESSKSARDLKVKSTLENRFVESKSGVTTIGFGSSSKPCGSGTSSSEI